MGYLLVDDNKAAKLLLRAFLVRLGVTLVEEASDSISALRLLMATPPSQSPFRGVFISRSMPEMSGLELVRTIRQLPGWSSFPIVIVSEDLNPVLATDAKNAGATDYILRPYGEDELRAIHNRIMGRNQPPPIEQ